MRPGLSLHWLPAGLRAARTRRPLSGLPGSRGRRNSRG